jgi:hypothetical protein
MMDRRGQTSMPKAGFEPTVSAFKRSRPTPQPALPLGQAPLTGQSLVCACQVLVLSLFMSVFQCYTGYWFSIAFRWRFTASSGVKSSASSLFPLPFPLHFGSYSSSFRRPGLYSLRLSVIGVSPTQLI